MIAFFHICCRCAAKGCFDWGVLGSEFVCSSVFGFTAHKHVKLFGFFHELWGRGFNKAATLEKTILQSYRWQRLDSTAGLWFSMLATFSQDSCGAIQEDVRCVVYCLASGAQYGCFRDSLCLTKEKQPKLRNQRNRFKYIELTTL